MRCHLKQKAKNPSFILFIRTCNKIALFLLSDEKQETSIADLLC